MTRVWNDGLRLPPAELRLEDTQLSSLYGRVGDGILNVSYHEHTAQYIIECKGRNTPQSVKIAMSQARLNASVANNLLPIVIVPYLSDDTLTFLEKEGVSGVDLSGNGVLLAPDFAVWRSGQPNQYPEVQSVKNLYRGVSSIFVRCLLLRAEFSSLKYLQEYALSRLYQGGALSKEGTRLTMGTASKVVQRLEEELLVRRDEHGLRVADTKRLMDGLRISYRSPDGTRLAGKTSLPVDEIWRRLGEQQITVRGTGLTRRYAATGLGSAARYRLLSGPDKLSLYVTDLAGAADLIELRATRVFPNVELIEEKEDAVYFDARRDGAEVWASPVQTWLEMVTGGPRERDAAQTLELALAKSQGEHLT